MTETEIAWAAGLFEGEGTMVVRRGKYAMMAVRMCDRDIVEKFHRTVGCGTVGHDKRTERNPLHRDTWVWQVATRADVLRLVTAFLPYLGERRSERAQEVIAVASMRDGRSTDLSARWRDRR